MTWTAASDGNDFFAPAAGDLRSLIHQELRLLAYHEPLSHTSDEVQPEQRHAAQLELTAMGKPDRYATGAHRSPVAHERVRTSRWSAVPWKTVSA